MTNLSGDPLPRLKAHDDHLRVVLLDSMHLSHYRNDKGQNVLTREYTDLWTHYTNDGTVRVGTAAHPDDDPGWFIHAANGLYVERELEKRDLTEAEVEWCEGTVAMYAGDNRPDSVYEFGMPHPEDLRADALSEDGFKLGLKSTIEDSDERHRVLTALQERYEREHLRSTKLNDRKGYSIDLPPEWDPEDRHNDRKSRRHLYDMTSMRADTALGAFETVSGFPYLAFRKARGRLLDVHEPKLDHHNLVALDVAGVPDWSYCRHCGAVAPADRFLHVERRGDDTGRRRVCDECAEWDPTDLFTTDAVERAHDRRAQEHGGQRRLGGEYAG